jgi:hypothetical protein
MPQVGELPKEKLVWRDIAALTVLIDSSSATAHDAN